MTVNKLQEMQSPTRNVDHRPATISTKLYVSIRNSVQYFRLKTKGFCPLLSKHCNLELFGHYLIKKNAIYKKAMEISRFPLAQKFAFSFSSMQYAIGKAIPFYTQLLLLVELNANGGAFISFRTYQSEPREQEDTAKRCLALTAKLLALELLSPISILILALSWGGKMQLFLVTSQEYEKKDIIYFPLSFSVHHAFHSEGT